MARSRGIKLPDAGDVPKVGIASDPGLRVPDLSGGIGEGLQTLAGGLREFADFQNTVAAKQKYREDLLASSRTRREYEMATMTEFQRRLTEDDISRPEFLEDFNTYLDTQRQTSMEGLEGLSEDARIELELKLQSSQDAMWRSAANEHLRASQTAVLDETDALVNKWSAQARLGGNLENLLLTTDNELGDFAPLLTPEQERAARVKARASVIESSVFGLIDKGRLKEARAILADTRFDADIDPSRRNVMGNAIEIEQKRLETEAKQRAAEQKALYLTGYEDYVAFLQSGGTPDGRYSRSEILKVVGAEHGVRLADQVERAEKFGETYRSVEFATQPELQEMLAKEQADLGKPEDFRTEAAELSTLAKAVEQRNSWLLNDPAQFVLGSRPVREAFDAMTKATGTDLPAATAAYAAAQEAEQLRLGIATPQYLTDAEADQIAFQFQSQGTGGESAAQVLQTLAERWGRKWPAVYGQLAASNKLPTSALMIGAGMSAPAATKLAEASKTGREGLLKILPTQTENEATTTVVRNNVFAALSEIRPTFMFQVGGDKTFAAVQENAELLTLQYLSEGDSLSTAVEKAVGAMPTAQYEVVDTYRVPLTYDADAIEIGANRALGELLTKRGSEVDLPTSLTGLPEADTHQRFLRTIQNEGYWVTAPDESGAELFVGDAAVTIGGRPYRKTWQELLSAEAPGVQFDPESGTFKRDDIGGGAGADSLGGGGGEDVIRTGSEVLDKFLNKHNKVAREISPSGRQLLSQISEGDREQIARNWGKWSWLFGHERNVNNLFFRMEQDERNMAIRILKLKQR